MWIIDRVIKLDEDAIFKLLEFAIKGGATSKEIRDVFPGLQGYQLATFAIVNARFPKFKVRDYDFEQSSYLSELTKIADEADPKWAAEMWKRIQKTLKKK